MFSVSFFATFSLKFYTEQKAENPRNKGKRSRFRHFLKSFAKGNSFEFKSCHSDSINRHFRRFFIFRVVFVAYFLYFPYFPHNFPTNKTQYFQISALLFVVYFGELLVYFIIDDLLFLGECVTIDLL